MRTASLLIGLLAAGCGSKSMFSAGDGSDLANLADALMPADAARPADARQGDDAASAALKPEITGIAKRDGIPEPQFQRVENVFVLQVHWSDLQPTAMGPIAANNAIDTTLTTVQKLNAANPSLHMRFKIRLYTGIDAPDWAKSLGGPPIAVQNPQSGVSGTIGRFWLSGFGDAYRDLHTKLAAQYDAVPEIGDVTVARCMTVYAETFLRNAGDPQTTQNLLDAGFTLAADKQCLHEQIDAHQVWKQTHASVAFNPYQAISRAGDTVDEAFTESMIDYCRAMLGKRCTLENNSIRSTPQSPNYDAMYAKIHAMGPPMAFQTATAAKIGDLRQTLMWAVGQGANHVELPAGGMPTPDKLGDLDAQLEANPQ